MQTSDTEMAKLASEFLKRVSLKGDEVPAFMAVQQWLMSKAGTKSAMPPQPQADPVPDPMPHEQEEHS